MKLTFKVDKWNTKYTFLAIFGGCISITGYLIYALDPIQSLIDKFLMLQPGSILFKLWTNPPYEVFANIYIFNITNSDRFLAGKEKLNVVEVGPYVYQEILKNSDGYLNENNTLTFKPTRKLVFRKDLSPNDPYEDFIITPNIPLLGVSSLVKEKFGYLMNLGLASIANMINSKPIERLTPDSYLFGYEDPLVTLASTYIPSWIDFHKFGIVDRIMALDGGNNIVTLHLTNSTLNYYNNDNDTILPYSINTFNGSPGLKQWDFSDENVEKNTQCNTIEGAFDGGLFPRNLKENTTLKLYRRAFCRSVNMHFENANYTSDGIKYYNYRVDQDFLSTSKENPNNKCYCLNKNNCLPKGFGSLAPCYYGIPIVMSQPHYLNADEKVLSQINGLKPNKEKHDTTMKIAPSLGVPMEAKLRIQINLKVSNDQVVSRCKPFQGMIVPLFWIELSIDETPFLVKLVLHLIKSETVIKISVVFIFLVTGMSLMALSWLFMCYFPSRRRLLEDPYGNRVGYSPILTVSI